LKSQYDCICSYFSKLFQITDFTYFYGGSLIIAYCNIMLARKYLFVLTFYYRTKYKMVRHELRTNTVSEYYSFLQILINMYCIIDKETSLSLLFIMVRHTITIKEQDRFGVNPSYVTTARKLVHVSLAALIVKYQKQMALRSLPNVKGKWLI
jgi:hypothetical protein